MLNIIRQRLTQALQLNLLATNHLRRHAGSKALRVYRQMHCAVAATANIKLNAPLQLGCQWPDGRYLPSQLVMRAQSQLHINGAMRIYSGAQIWINQAASLSLGSGYINNDLRLSCFERIEIGDNVVISERVSIRDSDNHQLDGRPHTAPVVIGNGVWIGMNVTILKGVTIGDGAVIAAAAVVTRDIPSGALAGGVPAKVIRKPVKWQHV